jgi:hypothetical protein
MACSIVRDATSVVLDAGKPGHEWDQGVGEENEMLSRFTGVERCGILIWNIGLTQTARIACQETFVFWQEGWYHSSVDSYNLESRLSTWLNHA